MTEQSTLLRLAVLGGTGAEGGGLAYRWALAGHTVTIGSRDAAKAVAAAAAMNARLGRDPVKGCSNEEAVRDADIVVLAVPYAAQMPTALAVKDGLAGKILVDVTAPLKPPKVGTVQLPEGGSCVAALQAALPEVKLVSAFQNVSAHHLPDADYAIDCDVLVCGDDKAARERVIALVEAAGMRGIHAGPLANSAASEALTSVLIFINRTYKVAGSGIRITGLDAGGAHPG
jgi:NADPH-dependent F420 reductase